MKKTEIPVPTSIRYLSEWPDLLNLIPGSKIIINKRKTGCGGTTLFLKSDLPLILVSPRVNLLYSKHLQFPNTHLFRQKDDSRTVDTLKKNLGTYYTICTGPLPFPGMKKITPIVLVTVDSYKYVAEQLSQMGVLQEFIVLVDEFQELMSDSKFKGTTEIEFLHNLRGLKKIIYLSATPIPEPYIEQMDDFADVDYTYDLIWDPSVMEVSRLQSTPYKKGETARSICVKVIKEFQQNGYFARKKISGVTVKSLEAVFFVNEVATILQVIKDAKLDPNDVNVLCSVSNKRIPELTKMGVHVGELCTDEENPVNRTFTFCTRASFSGVDFYSNSAMTYIFSDGVLDWHTHDIIIDVPQILGRQRLDRNPFWKDAVLFYRPQSKVETMEKAAARIQQKVDNSINWIKKFNACDDSMKLMLADGIRKRDPKKKYDDDYVDIVDDTVNGGFVAKLNYLVRNVEIRDYQLAAFVYSNPIYLLATLDSSEAISVTSTAHVSSSDSPELDTFRQNFFKTERFSDRMKAYAEFRKDHSDMSELLYQDSFIDFRYHDYFDTLGPDILDKLNYKEADIEQAYQVLSSTGKILTACRSRFVSGGKYTLKEVKEAMQEIYDSLGLQQRAKAVDIEKYLDVEKKQLTSPATKKRELYYVIK